MNLTQAKQVLKKYQSKVKKTRPLAKKARQLILKCKNPHEVSKRLGPVVKKLKAVKLPTRSEARKKLSAVNKVLRSQEKTATIKRLQKQSKALMAVMTR